MRTHVRVLAAVAFTLCVAGVVAADTGQVRAFIPFDFTVRGTTLPAGTYYVSRQFGNDMLTIRSLNNGVMVLGNREDAKNPQDSPTRLIFHRYGDRYFLNQIWMDEGRGYQLPESVQEKEVAKSASATLPAATVTIAMNK
jgi:hypothetical protein